MTKSYFTNMNPGRKRKLGIEIRLRALISKHHNIKKIKYTIHFPAKLIKEIEKDSELIAKITKTFGVELHQDAITEIYSLKKWVEEIDSLIIEKRCP